MISSVSGSCSVIVKVFVMASCRVVLDVQQWQPNTTRLLYLLNVAPHMYFFGLVADECVVVVCVALVL